MSALKPGSPEWLSMVTPSKVAPILGISPYTDPYSQWHIMAGHIVEAETDEMRRGTYHEAAVLREFYHRNPDLCREPLGHRTIRVSEWLACTPDSIAVPRSRKVPRVRIMVEIKTTGDWDAWGEPGTDQIPEHYLAQVITCAHVAGVDEIRVFVLGPFWEYREYRVALDPVLAEAVLAQCHEFWLTVQSGDEPPLSDTVSSYDTWAKVADPTLGEGDAEIPTALAQRYLTAVAGEKDVKPARAAIVNILDAAGAKYATWNGHKVATRQRSSSGGASIVVARKPPVIHPALEALSA